MEKTDPKSRRIVNAFRNSTKNKDYFRRLAEYLEKPSRKAPEANVSKLDRLCKTGESVVVPGKVLGFGELKKKLTVYGQSFSKQAVEKIEKSGGKCHSLEELLSSGKMARIIT
jgi:large subunit ribosomal protein L18e